MKAIHIREVPAETLDSLKRLARIHHRSLQGELHLILEDAARTAPPPAPPERLKLVTVRTGSKSTWHREEIYGDAGR